MTKQLQDILDVGKELQEILEANPNIQIFGIVQDGKCVELSKVSDHDKSIMLNRIKKLLND